MEKNEKGKSDFDKLKDVYKSWDQFMSKTKIKMKKKIKKDKKEYYDFDYTRGQYYYNYPEYHINFAPPDIQRQFFKDLLIQQTKPISDVYLSHSTNSLQIQQQLRPQELHDFLRDIKDKLHQQICMLRIQKSFFIQENHSKQNIINLMEDQIRSFNCRYIRLQNIYFTFSKSMTQRLQDRTTTLKLKKFDQLHFSQLEKGDFVVYLRMEGVKQRLTFELVRLKNEIQMQIIGHKAQIIKRCYQKRGARIKAIQKYQGEKYFQRKNRLQQYFLANQPIFFDNQQNLRQLQNYLLDLNYTKQMNKSKLFFDVKYCLKQVEYVPSNDQELKEILFTACKDYFPKEMIDNLYHHKKEHLCYRLNYFASIILRTIIESYHFIVEIKEKDLHSLRNTMKRQLQTVFTSQADKLFNIMQHQIICLVDQQSYSLPQFSPISSSQSENIFKQYFKINKIVDPFTRSVLNLLSVTNDKTIKEVVDSYISWVGEISPMKLKYLSLYYKNYHNDDKSHIINLLNAKLTMGGVFSEAFLQQKLKKILNQNGKMDEGLLRITYLLLAINNIQLKKQLDNIINAQISIMYKVKYKIQLLKYKHSLPFQMSSEFIARFTQNNYTHDFIQNSSQNINPNPYPDIQYHDKIFRVKKQPSRQKIEVRRIIPQNPLFEGKRIIYNEAIKESGDLIEKLHNICAHIIEKRQNYLHQQKFTGIVDRFQLVNRLLLLELQYHNKKLQYLEEALILFDRTIHPEGFYLVAEEIYKAKYREVYFSLDQPHFEQRYTDQTQLWKYKAILLSKIRNKQMSFQDREKDKFRQGIMKHNHVNNVPEISSIYYSDQFAMQDEDNIIEQHEDQSLSQELNQSQLVANSSKYRSDLSGISSEYHVKTTFKQILGKGSVNAQAADQNRREELMGRKRKKLLNDSVLGGILKYQQCKYYHFIHETQHFMNQMEDVFADCFDTDDIGIKAEFYEQVCKFVELAEQASIKDLTFIQQDMLNKLLGDCNRAITKVIEKYKNSPNSLDDYLFFNSKIFKNVIQNSTFSNLNDLRGLYTCLNVVKLFKNYSSYYLQSKVLENTIVQKLHSLSKKYSGESLSKQTKFFNFSNLKQKFQNCSLFNLLDCPSQSNSSRHLLFLSNNSVFTNTTILTYHSIINYYKYLLYNFYQQIFDCKSFLNNLQLIQNYGVYCDENILDVVGVQNRLFIRRKIEGTNDKMGRLFKTKNIQEMVSLPYTSINLIKKYSKHPVLNQNHLYQNIVMFEDFIVQIASAATIINISSEKLRLKMQQNQAGSRLQKIIKILPFANQTVQIKPNSFNIYKQIFQQNFKNGVMIDKSIAGSIVIQYNRISAEYLGRSIFRDALTDLKNFIKPLLLRKYKQFDLNEQALERYYDYMESSRLEEPYQLASQHQLKELFDIHSQINKKLNLLVWVECKLLLFGANLQPDQLLFFRSVLENVVKNAYIFFRDESNRLVNYHDIVKMKIDSVDSTSIKQKYISCFLNYENLKLKYRSFLDGLSEFNINNEGKDIMNIIYLGNKQAFNYCNRILPEYLANYCCILSIKNQMTHFVHFIIRHNPNRFLRTKLARRLTFSLLKTFLWNSQDVEKFKRQIFFLEQRCQIMKHTLNSNNTKMKDITTQLSLQLYSRQRMKQLYDFLQIPVTKKSRIEYSFFLKKLQEKLLLGIDKLNPTQKYLSKFIEKILKQKPEFGGIKDQILQKIYQSRFYQDLVMTRLIGISMQTLNRDLKLYQILFENYYQKEMIRENKIIKSTLNKVLVPKIIINPYLQSPLILQNYFFAASLKLSYVDSFLNKLKNRAIMVQLAEGGFGFLLKISELDQSIQSLCKGIITFTEKEFNDRFRTFLESYDQVRQKYKKSTALNQSLKNMIDICREQWGKEVKSVLYAKLNSYLGTIHTKQKSYQSIFNIVKSLELQIAKKIDAKYEARVHLLQQQNKKLKEQFIEYQKISVRNAKSSMEQSKDTLYNSFKRQVESILNKEVVKDYAQVGQRQHKQQEEFMSTVLLKRLRKQKLFYQMKINSIESKLRQKSSQIIKLKEELNMLDNTLTSQQFKNAKLTDQIKKLFDKNIEIEELKKEIHKKQQEETLNKFKLIKINQHLQGKITRLEEKTKNQATFITEKEQKKNEQNVAIQTHYSHQKQKRNFKIRTEHSQPPIQNQNKVDEVHIWKEKWQHSERKYHVLMSKIVQSYQIYRINKSSMKLIERISQIFEECMSNQITRKK